MEANKNEFNYYIHKSPVADYNSFFSERTERFTYIF